MKNAVSRVASVLSSTALAAAVTMALGWPSQVNAVGSEEQAAQQQAELAKQEAAPENAALSQNQSKIGDLEVTATLATSEGVPGRQVIRLECSNPTSGRIEGQVQLALTRTSGSGGERVMPTPKVTWRQNENVAVEPGATLIREVMLPKNLGAEVARIQRLQKAAEGSETARFPSVYFGVMAQPLETQATPAAKRQAAQRLSMQKTNNLATAPSSVPRLASNRSKLGAVPKMNSVEFGY